MTYFLFALWAVVAGLVRGQYGDFWFFAWTVGFPASLFAGAWVLDKLGVRPPRT